MGKIITNALQLRLEYQAKVKRPVPLQEVADALGLDRRILSKIEAGKMQRYDADVMQKIADFYTSAGLDARRILEYDPEGIRMPGYTGTALAAA